MLCDCCDYEAKDNGELMTHFERQHPKEYLQRCLRPKDEMQDAPDHVNRWRRYVLDNEGLGDWIIVIGEPYCWIQQKHIMVYPSTDHVGFLHEVAHALYPYPETLGKGEHFHGSQWGSTFGSLVKKYMDLRPWPVKGWPVSVIPPNDPTAVFPSGDGQGEPDQA